MKESRKAKSWISNVINLSKKLKYYLDKIKLANSLVVLSLLLIWYFKRNSDSEIDEIDNEFEDQNLLNYFYNFKKESIEFLIYILVVFYIILYSFINSYKNKKLKNSSNDVNETNLNKMLKLVDTKINTENMNLKYELNDLKNMVENLNKQNNELKITYDKKYLDFKNKSKQIVKQIETDLLNETQKKIDDFKNLYQVKLNTLEKKYHILDSNKQQEIRDMFETADVAVELIKRRDQQLNELYKTTTELMLKKDSLNEEFLLIKKCYEDLVKDIRLNNEDFVKFIENSASMVEELIMNKVKTDIIKITNNFEELKSTTNNKLNEFLKLNKDVVNIEKNITYLSDKNNNLEEKLKMFNNEINDFRDITENLTIYLNTNVTGKINGILKFLGVSLI